MIVDSTKHFRPYIYGRQFIIETDHKPLVWLFSLKDPNSRLVRWQLRLEEFDYKIQYKKGKDNIVADALSWIEINIKETVDGDDIDLILSLPQIDQDEFGELSPDDADEILSKTLEINVWIMNQTKKEKQKRQVTHNTLRWKILYSHYQPPKNL